MDQLETTLAYRFADRALLKEALTHPSVSKQEQGAAFNNQRLEFLGDAVLGLVIAEMLYRLYPKEDEGGLAKRQAALVRKESLCQVARKITLGDYLICSASEEQGGGRTSESNLEDACEALIGALYLDGGFAAAERFIVGHWEALARSMSVPPQDAKTALQEWAQARALPLPVYKVVENSGPAHAPLFTIEVQVEGQPPLNASGTNKRIAEQGAARAMLDYLEEHGS